MTPTFLQNEFVRAIMKVGSETQIPPDSFLIAKPENVFRNNLQKRIDRLNFLYKEVDRTYNHLYINSITLKTKADQHKKGFIGTGLVLAGQLILKKRFVTRGSAVGTSIASKYLREVFPQKLPVRLLGANVVGAVIGRAVPCAG